jgi:hypothetical protein
VKHLARHINAILDALGLNDEIFAIGNSAMSLGKAIVGQLGATPIRRSADRHIATIIVDRSIDLVSPLIHQDNIIAFALEQSLDPALHSADVLFPEHADPIPVSLSHACNATSLKFLKNICQESLEYGIESFLSMTF